MKSAYTYDILSTEIYSNGSISDTIDEVVYGITHGGIVTDCAKREVRVKAIVTDRFGFINYIIRESSGYTAYEPHIRNESWTSVQLSNRTSVFSKATLSNVVEALGAKKVVKLASLERGSTDRARLAGTRDCNVDSAISGVAHAAAAYGYRKAAREYAGMTRDIIAGDRTTGSKAGDITLGILGAIGAAAAMSECSKEVERSSTSFSRIRW